jgi:tetratricopeptide (TPR) repeat protein
MRALLDAITRPPTSRARRWLPAIAVTGGLVVLGLGLRGAAHTEQEREPTSAAKPQISAPVQALLDASIELDHASDPRGSVVPLDHAIDLATAASDEAGLALAWAARGSQLGKLAEYERAIDDLERSFNLATEIDRTDIAADAAIIRVGLLAQELGRADEALTWGRHVESILGRDDTLELRLRADFEESMGRVHYHLHEYDLAHARYVKAVELLRSDQPHLERHLASALMLLGQTEMARGDLEAARAAMVESVAFEEHVHGPDHPDVGAAYGNLAGISAELGDFEAARDYLEQAREIIVAAQGDRHPNVLAIDASVASLLMRKGEYEQARARLEDALPRADAGLPITCGVHERLGVTLGHLDRVAEGEAQVKRALDCYAAIFGEDSEDAASARLSLQELADQKKNLDRRATGASAEPPAPRDP